MDFESQKKVRTLWMSVRWLRVIKKCAPAGIQTVTLKMNGRNFESINHEAVKRSVFRAKKLHFTMFPFKVRRHFTVMH